jgi:hypothetical protein
MVLEQSAAIAVSISINNNQAVKDIQLSKLVLLFSWTDYNEIEYLGSIVWQCVFSYFWNKQLIYS